MERDIEKLDISTNSGKEHDIQGTGRVVISIVGHQRHPK